MCLLTVVLKAASNSRYLPYYHAKDNLAAWNGTHNTQESYPCFYFGYSKRQFSTCLLHSTGGADSGKKEQPQVALFNQGNWTHRIQPSCPVLCMYQQAVYFSFKTNNPFTTAALILMAFKHLNASEDPDQGELTASIPY